MRTRLSWLTYIVPVVFALHVSAPAQVTQADYERAQGLRDPYQYATRDVPDGATWIGKTNRFYYRKTVAGGHAFVLVDAMTLEKRAAFDHDERALEFTVGRTRWRCPLSDYACTREEPPPQGEVRRGITGPVRAIEASAPGKPKPSPDGAWEAIIINFNVAVRKAGSPKAIPLSTDGSEGDYYDPASMVWSPDSTKLAVYRVRPGYRRLVH